MALAEGGLTYTTRMSIGRSRGSFVLASRNGSGRTRPWGLSGGEDGAAGATGINADGREELLPGKFSREVKAGTRVRIESPGGGGWGGE